MLKCKLCPNKRYSNHWKCLYCKPCAAKKNDADIAKGHLKYQRINKTHLKTYRQVNYHRYKDNRNTKNKLDAKMLTDVYIRHVLCSNSTLNKADLTQELINMKRLEMKLARERRSNNAKNNGA